jgi:hypothetical protein
MEKMDKMAEGRIVRAIEEAIELTNKGIHPNEAIQKQAEHHKFGPNVVQRMVEAYNTSRTLAHLKHASGHARADDFTIADAATVLGKMYPKEVVTSSKLASAGTHRSYARAEQVNYLRKNAGTSPPPLTKEKVGPIARSPELEAHSRFGDYHASMRKVADARTTYRQKHYELWSHVKKASDYFKLLYREPFAEVEKRAVSEYGQAGKSVMDLVYELSNRKEKRAELKGIRQMTYDVDAEPYNHIADAVKTASEIFDAASLVLGFEKDRDVMAKAAGVVEEKKISDDLQSCVLDSTLGGINRPFEKNALLPTPDISGAMLLAGGMGALGLKEPDAASISNKATLDAADPYHEADMTAIRSRAMLNDMLSNDPIISSYDPDEVRQAYNAMSQLSPRLSSQPGVVRAMLRRLLQQEGVIEPHEASQLTETEKNLSQMERFTSPVGSKSLG